MLQNAYLLAKIGADTAETERNFAENLPTIGNYPVPERVERARASERRSAEHRREGGQERPWRRHQPRREYVRKLD